MRRTFFLSWNGWMVIFVGVVAMSVWPAAVEQAFAHKVTVFAWVDGDTVHTESKFSGGRVAKQARIEVFDSSGNQLLNGLTDDAGRFDFTTPKKEELKIVLIAGAGHRNEWVVKAEEFSGQMPLVAEDEPVQSHETASPIGDSMQEDIALSRDDLQAMIEAALDKKLQPVLHRLYQLDEGPRLTEIVGGIGYILGLVGLGAYFHYRRRSSSEGTRAR
jgi:nickel transport protein